MRTRVLVYLAGMFFFSQSMIADADPGDREAILAVMDKAFAAVRSGNPDDW